MLDTFFIFKSYKRGEQNMKSLEVFKKCFTIVDGLETFITWSFQLGFNESWYMSQWLRSTNQVIFISSSSDESYRTLISASFTPGNQHIYFSCKTADCQAVFAQSPNNYPITVFVVQGIERGLPSVDWVKFLWLASHPSEKIHNDEGIPGQFAFQLYSFGS